MRCRSRTASHADLHGAPCTSWYSQAAAQRPRIATHRSGPSCPSCRSPPPPPSPSSPPSPSLPPPAAPARMGAARPHADARRATQPDPGDAGRPRPVADACRPRSQCQSNRAGTRRCRLRRTCVSVAVCHAPPCATRHHALPSAARRSALCDDVLAKRKGIPRFRLLRTVCK